MNLRHLQLPRSWVNSIVYSQCSENDARLMVKRWAGHSKWANIKHTKMMKDMNKSTVFTKLCHKIMTAVKENGENPDFNSKLRSCIEEARRVAMPNITIQNAIKKALASKFCTPSWLIYTRPDGFAMGFEVASNNVIQIIGKINQHTKRLDLKHNRNAESYFIEKGIILCDPNKDGFDKAVEDGINIGAHEVEEGEDKTLVFQCSPQELNKINKLLSDMGYTIQSSSSELEFHKNVKVLPDEEKVVETIKNKLLELDELVRITDNIEK